MLKIEAAYVAECRRQEAEIIEFRTTSVGALRHGFDIPHHHRLTSALVTMEYPI